MNYATKAYSELEFTIQITFVISVLSELLVYLNSPIIKKIDIVLFMIIFLRSIPSDTKKYEIANFISPVFSDCFLEKATRTISLEDIEILAIQDVDSNNLEKHGLVRVFPNEVAKRLIKRLDGKFFKQKRITVREYINRSAEKDPRNSFNNITIDFKDRRIGDRRRVPLMNSWQKDPILVHTIPAM